MSADNSRDHALQYAGYLDQCSADFRADGCSATASDYAESAELIRELHGAWTKAVRDLGAELGQNKRALDTIIKLRETANELALVCAELRKARDKAMNERDALRRHMDRIREQTGYALAGDGAKKV